ncbi:MAG: MATE family efflux transporter [Eubacteriales bacterium]
MKKNVDLLNGSIAGALTRLALPIMATSFLQMAYNLTDMIWIGKVGSDAVAAVGVAGMFIWLANGIAMIPRIGGQVKVGQSLGAEKEMEAASYAKSAFQVAITLGVLYGVLCFCFHHGLVEFFQMDNQQIVQDAEQYLMVTCGLVTISFMNQIFTGTWTAIGNSTVTLRATLIGLSINLILDPVLIFGIGPFPELGTLGAAIATVFAQLIVFVVFCVVSRREKTVFMNMNHAFQIDWNKVKSILQVGFPAGFQNMMFTGISMIVARMITSFGDAAIAVQKVGTQIESISWMTAEGFGTAVNALIAQNHGARQENRVDKGYRTAIIIMGAWGILTSFVLIVFPEPLFRIFIQEENVVPLGIDYLRIVGYSQLFMCMELATAGAFQGLGKTLPPSISGITFTVIRIPLAYALAQTSLGLNGIWWAITISAIAKGVVLPIWFLKHRSKDNG